MNPWLFDPPGLPVPVAEDAPTVDATRRRREGLPHRPHRGGGVRAPSRAPRTSATRTCTDRTNSCRASGSIVRRILDGRDRIVVADDGLTLHHHGYTENLAHALLLAVDQPDAAAGKIFNVGDEEVLSIRQVDRARSRPRSAIALEIVSMPFELALPARPLLAQPLPTHRVLDISSGPRTTSATATSCRRATAVAATARWLADHPCEPGGLEEMVLTDPFDYAAEDRLIDAWHARDATHRPTPGFDDRRPATGSRTAGPAGGRAATRSSTRDRSAPARRHQDRRPVDRAHRPVRGRAARRPGRRRRQGRTARLRRHRALRRRVRQRAQRARPDVQPRQALARARRAPADEGREILLATRRATPTSSCRTSGPASSSGSASATTTCAAVNERVVYASLSGFGPIGPVRRQGRVRHRDPGVRRVRREPGRRRAPASRASSTRPRPTRSPRCTPRRRSPPRCSPASATGRGTHVAARDARRGRVVPVGRRGRQRGAAGRRPLAAVELRAELPAVPLHRRLGHLHADLRRRLRGDVPGVRRRRLRRPARRDDRRARAAPRARPARSWTAATRRRPR